MARPMVVGDRLWLFSQTPNETAPVQNLLLNNTQPVIPSITHSNIRPSTINGILDITRNALISRGQTFTNYGYTFNSSPYINAKNNTMPHQSYIDGSYYKTMMRPKVQMEYEQSNKNSLISKGNYNKFYQDDPNSYLPNTYCHQIENFSPIINLERAFGSHNESLIPSSHDLKVSKNADICDNDSSDIDCEAIEDNNNN